MKNVRAQYMQWAKQHPRARWDLCGSDLLPCALDDLPEAAAALQLNGPNDEGYAPLVEAIPRRFHDDYALDPDLVARALTDRTRLIIMTNLHNPSGVRASDDALAGVGRLAERIGAHVLVDEVYLESSFATVRLSDPRTLGPSDLRPSASLSDRFISTSSLTKSYGLAGLRCGWALASPDVAERVRRGRDIVDGTGVFPAERMSVVAFEHLDRLAARALSILEPNFALVRRFLDGRRELEYVRPAGGTVVFPRLRGQANADAFVDRLLREEEVGVVPGRFFQAPAHFRLAFGGPRETLQCGLEGIGRMLDRSE
jgi:aspartate/methionine/tyrosine aminotransferase